MPALDLDTPLLDVLSLHGTHDDHDFLFRILDYVLKVRETYLDSLECICQDMQACPALQQALGLRGTAALTAILNTAKLDQECSFCIENFADFAVASCLDPVNEEKASFDFELLARHILLATWNGKSSFTLDGVRGCVRLAVQAHDSSLTQGRDAMEMLPPKFQEPPSDSQALSYLNASLRTLRHADLLAGEQEFSYAAEILSESDLTGAEDILTGLGSLGLQLPHALTEALVEPVCVSSGAPASSSSTHTMSVSKHAWKMRHVAVIWRALRSKLDIRDFTFVQVPDALRRCSIDHETSEELDQAIQQHCPKTEEIDLALSALRSLLNRFLDFKDRSMRQVADWAGCEVCFLTSLPSNLKGRTRVEQSVKGKNNDEPLDSGIPLEVTTTGRCAYGCGRLANGWRPNLLASPVLRSGGRVPWQHACTLWSIVLRHCLDAMRPHRARKRLCKGCGP